MSEIEDDEKEPGKILRNTGLHAWGKVVKTVSCVSKKIH